MWTYLERFINTWCDKFHTKMWLFKTYLTRSVFFFFLGFMCGNLFGTFLVFFRQWIIWDGFLILLTILFIELIHYLNFYVFKSNDDFKLYDTQYQSSSNMNTLNRPRPRPIFDWFHLKIGVRLLNFYKLGLLFGFFVDAFKVGS
jgi:hypothetical protein